jgi:hypothetical protein
VRLILWRSPSRDWLLLANPVSRLLEPVAGCTLPHPLPGRAVGRVLGVRPCLSGAADSRRPEHMAFVAALRDLQ